MEQKSACNFERIGNPPWHKENETCHLIQSWADKWVQITESLRYFDRWGRKNLTICTTKMNRTKSHAALKEPDWRNYWRDTSLDIGNRQLTPEIGYKKKSLGIMNSFWIFYSRTRNIKIILTLTTETFQPPLQLPSRCIFYIFLYSQVQNQGPKLPRGQLKNMWNMTLTYVILKE